MKQLSAILFLAIFAVSSNGTWVLNWVNHHEMRSKVNSFRQTGKNHHEVERFEFTPAELGNLAIEDDGKELEYNGKMYDIIDITEAEGKFIVSCFHDKKETHFKLWSKHHRSHKKPRIKNTLAKVYHPSTRVDPNIISPGRCPSVFSFRNTAALCCPAVEILKPPPDFLPVLS